jgi:hypothetical protein
MAVEWNLYKLRILPQVTLPLCIKPVIGIIFLVMAGESWIHYKRGFSQFLLDIFGMGVDHSPIHINCVHCRKTVHSS